MRLRRVIGAAGAVVAIVATTTAGPAVAVPVGSVVAAASTGYIGVVGDESGQPVAGACLTLLRSETEEQGRFCADAQGHYAISGVPTDTGYRVRVTAPGYRTHWWPDAPDHLNAETVWVPGTSLVRRDVTVGRGSGTIRGRIVDDSGAPAEATVSIWATDRDWRVLAYTTPGGDGRYEIANLPPGRYQAALFNDVYGNQWMPGSQDRTAASAYPLADGQTLVLDERWLPLGTVEVRVTDTVTGLGVPRPCARIDTPLRTVAACGAAGLVRLGQVPPGRWAVAVDAVPSHFAPDQPVPVDVVRGAVAPLAVELAAGAGVTTTVRDAATGEPADRVCVRLVAPKWGGQPTGQGGYCSDETGRLAIGPLTTSTTAQLYAYQAVDPYDPPARRYGAQWVTANGGSGDQRAALRVAIRTGTTVAIAPIRMDPPGAVSGTVSDATTGAPVPGVCAHPYAFRPDQGPGHGRHCSAADGRYTIDDLGPYRWPVQFVPAPGSRYAWQWSGDVADRFSASLARVPAGGTATVPARLVTGGTLAGTVTRNGGPAGSGYVWTYHRRTGDVAGAGPAYLRPDGGFVLPGHRTQEVYVEYRDPTTTCWYGTPTVPPLATAVGVTAGGTTTVAMDLTASCAPRPAG
ncbi:carboxypeptidase regulatory-like domain-containing protein [Plantactinospora sp. S1510]|uniref:Carboxypeptidase regulatory-like domain-containing protein n=1 Tax=Plantactinospora alkalitolerans TaxID=2789879 RepID=A0ABS0H5V4_9ACTN|nr:carboxypeptidase-like regulatory domain-containing protein [Plantactinospora alkalitolerans]MBF9133851.1 carboxypeptidase regulatory-like domain-containing protein [Plantactinospora alkalitolerans]